MSEAGSRIRCATLNVLGPANPDWEQRSTVIADALRALEADVVALQEVRAGDAQQLLGPDYQVTSFSAVSADGVTGVLATRAPHRVLEEIDQRSAEHGEDLAWCATLIVELEDSPVGRLVVAHHKPNWPFPLEVEREQQARRAALAVEAHAGEGPAVVLGDFDATPDAASVSFWRGRRSLDGVSVCYQDAWETIRPNELGVTFSAENPLVRAGEVATAVSRRIDYVLIRAGRHGALLRVLGCDRFLDQPVTGVWASDHYGVVADLAVPQHAPGTWGKVEQTSG